MWERRCAAQELVRPVDVSAGREGKPAGRPQGLYMHAMLGMGYVMRSAAWLRTCWTGAAAPPECPWG